MTDFILLTSLAATLPPLEVGVPCMLCLHPSLLTECSSLTFDELLMGRVEGVRMRRLTKVQVSRCLLPHPHPLPPPPYPQLHNEWVQCVRYCPSLEGLFSASTDPRAPLVLADVRGKSCLGKSVFRINKGVNSFDYSEAWNVIGGCV